MFREMREREREDQRDSLSCPKSTSAHNHRACLLLGPPMIDKDTAAQDTASPIYLTGAEL